MILNVWRTQKKSESQTGFKPTTLHLTRSQSCLLCITCKAKHTQTLFGEKGSQKKKENRKTENHSTSRLSFCRINRKYSHWNKQNLQMPFLRTYNFKISWVGEACPWISQGGTTVGTQWSLTSYFPKLTPSPLTTNLRDIPAMHWKYALEGT